MSNKTTEWLSRWLGLVKVRIVDVLPEVFWIGGAILLYCGIAEIYAPAAKIVLGSLLLFAGWRLAPVPTKGDSA